MRLYVQSVYIWPGRVHEVILDFNNIDDHRSLTTFLYRGMTAAPMGGFANESSMVRLTYRPIPHRGFREGFWYDIDLELLRFLEYIPVNEDDPGSLYLSANLGYLEDTASFSDSRIEGLYAELDELPEELSPTAYDYDGDMEITVVNCGHGNWNEIRSNDIRIFYDVGAGRDYRPYDVDLLIKRRLLPDDESPIIVVISHWDIDHYQAILRISPEELKKIRTIIVPSQTPNTVTYKRVIDRLKENNVPIFSIKPATSSIHASREIILVGKYTNGVITVFRATKGSSRNQTGIVIGIKHNGKVVLLTGDHHYSKVLNASSTSSGFSGSSCILVAPHHGGHAGFISVPDWKAAFRHISCIISCGCNSYGHPLKNVTDAIKAIQFGKPAALTRECGDITYKI